MRFCHALTLRLFQIASLLFPLVLALVVSVSTNAQQAAGGAHEQRDRGIKLYQQGDDKDAIKELRAAVSRNKDDGEAWHYLGLALVRTNDMKAARKAFEAAVKLRPGLGPAHSGFAYALMAMGRNEQAAQQAGIAIELDRTDSLAHYILGVVHLWKGNNTDALAEANLAIAHRPNLALAYLLKYQALLATQGAETSRSTRIARAPDPLPLSPEEIAVRKQHAKETAALFTAAADALQTYLKLAGADRGTAFWTDQLETLRLFADAPDQVGTPLSTPNWEVTTRARVLLKPEPSYTSEARSAGVVGTVILRAIFSSTGKVEHILVLRSLPAGLTERSIEVAKKIKFIPATKNGKPISMIIELQYNFNLY